MGKFSISDDLPGYLGAIGFAILLFGNVICQLAHRQVGYTKTQNVSVAQGWPLLALETVGAILALVWAIKGIIDSYRPKD